MKVAIWGSYSYGNYGDDIMAIQFAQHLKKIGANPYVFKLNKNLAEIYSIDVAETWDELFDGAHFCLIGGGGVLIDNLTASVDEEFKLLSAMSLKYSCPVFPISIGGEGKGVKSKLSDQRKTFFQGETCKTSTVRLEDDVFLLNSLGKEALYFPDVLLSVADFWNISPVEKKNSILHVGINLPDSPQGQFLVWQLSVIAAVRRDVVFHFIPTYLPDSSIHWELLPKSETRFIRRHTYSDPAVTLKFLSSLDLLISYKLHLGLTALALGVPFYSVGGPKKAHEFLRSVHADFAIFPSESKRWKLGLLLADLKNIHRAKEKFNFALIEQLKKRSWGHMDQITQIANMYS